MKKKITIIMCIIVSAFQLLGCEMLDEIEADLAAEEARQAEKEAWQEQEKAMVTELLEQDYWGYDLCVVEHDSPGHKTIKLYDFDRSVITIYKVENYHHSTDYHLDGTIKSGNIDGTINGWTTDIDNGYYKYDSENNVVTEGSKEYWCSTSFDEEFDFLNEHICEDYYWEVIEHLFPPM